MVISGSLDTVWGLLWYFDKAREYPGIHKRIQELRDESRLNEENWIKKRNRRLRNILASAQQHVPYYRKIFAKVPFDPVTAKVPDDLAKVPLLTKDVVREGLDSLIAKNCDRSRIFENATGGSTGVPLKFYQDLRYQSLAAAIDAHVREWWGIKPYDRTASIWGADREFHELSLKERLYEMRQRAKSLNAFRMTDKSLLQFCRTLERWKPPYLKGYSSALQTLALSAVKYGISNLQFKAIRSTAEMLYPHQRKEIHQALSGPVYDFYGSREVNNIAAECPEEKRLHLISAWRYVEIIDETGEPVPDGQSGHIAVTDLSNYAMPFIRYLNGDMARMATERCSCGRPTPVIEELLGRTTDIIRMPQGDLIHGEYFTHLFYGRNDIRQFQVHQKALDHIIVRYVPSGKPPREYMENVAERIRKRLGDGVKVEVELCEKIPVPLSGKHRFTISDVI